MKAESHTMTLKTKQHSWPRGVQFFRKHIMSGMWTRAWLSLFCLCFFLFFFYFEIVRVVHRRWTQCQTARLDLCTNILQGKGTFSTSENGGKNRKVFWAYHHNLCLSPIFLFFFYQIWVWASLSGLDTVEIQHESQTNTKWSEQYQQDDWKQCMHCMTAQGDNLEGCRFDWNSL